MDDSGNTAIRRENPPPTMISRRSVTTSRRVCQRDTARTRPTSQRDAEQSEQHGEQRSGRARAGERWRSRMRAAERRDRRRGHDERPHEHDAVLAGDRMDVLIGTEQMFELRHCSSGIRLGTPVLLPARGTQSATLPIAPVLFSSPNPIDPDEPLTRFLEMLPPLPTTVTRSTPRSARRRSCSQASTAESLSDTAPVLMEDGLDLVVELRDQHGAGRDVLLR